MNKLNCPYCSAVLEEGIVTIGIKNHSTLFQAHTRGSVYFHSSQQKSRMILGAFDEIASLHCLACKITIIGKYNSEIPDGANELVFVNNQRMRLKKLTSLFSSQDVFKEQTSNQDLATYYEDYLGKWTELLSHETTHLLQIHHTSEYNLLKAFYNILRSVDKKALEDARFLHTKTWMMLNEISRSFEKH